MINATGPFSDEIRKLDDPKAPPMLQVSSGAHIVLDGRFSSPRTGLLIPKTEDGRVIFILPWIGHTIIGTTDSYAEPTHKPPVYKEEIEYLLRNARTYFADPVGIDDVKSAWAGLRPLVADPQRATPLDCPVIMLSWKVHPGLLRSRAGIGPPTARWRRIRWITRSMETSPR